MLSMMRRHSRSIVIKLVYVGLILSFLIWGVGSYQSRKDFVAVTVNGTDILMNDYRVSFENQVNYYRQTLKDNFNEEMIAALKLKKKALDMLINRVILLDEADKQGIRVSKEEVSERIQSFQEFQKDGAFDKQTYFNVLNASRLKPADFEKEQRELMIMGKLEGTIKGGAVVSDEEVLDGYLREKTTVTLEFVKLSPPLFEKKMSSTEAEQKEYFSANVGAFTIPQKIRLGYVVFDPKDFRKEVKLTQEDYEDYYNSYIGDFVVPEKVKARHILIKYGDNREEAKKKAEDVLKRVEAGEDFAKLARKHSEDESSAKKGGDLGFFERGAMVKPFEEAAFSMEKGKISELVESIYGYHIINVLDKTEEKTKPLDEVRGDIRAVLEEEITRELAESRAEDIYYEALKGSKPLETLSAAESLPYGKTDLFGMDEFPSQLKGVADVVLNAGTMEPGWLSRPKEWENKFYLLTLIEKAPPREPAFEEVKDAVRKAVALKKAKEAAAAAGEKMLAEAKGGASLYKLATQFDLKAETTAPFSRVKNVAPGIGVSQEIVAAAFSLSAENPYPEKPGQVGDDVVVFRLKDVKGVDQKTFDEEKELYRSKLLDQRREQVFRQWLEEARKKATIAYSEDTVDLKD